MREWYYIDPGAAMPIYAQLERAIRFAVVTGKLRIGEQLPTVRQLAVDLRINANTVARVYGQLEREGLLETRRGVGTFVKQHPSQDGSTIGRKRRLQIMIDEFLAEAGALGFNAEDVVEAILNNGKKESRKNV
jgi:GntR family transcriptional regulator